jgi:sulfur transfer complex TusBCD TusB component (DsrH family)
MILFSTNDTSECVDVSVINFLVVFFLVFPDIYAHGSYREFVFSILVIYLQDFVKYNESHLKQLSCHIFDPVPLGDGAGIGFLKS